MCYNIEVLRFYTGIYAISFKVIALPTRFGRCPLPIQLSEEKVASYRVPQSPKDRKEVRFFREANRTKLKSSKSISSPLRHFLNERRPYLIQFDQHVLLLCFGCGYFLDVNLFDVDHVQSSKMILDRQKGMIKKMNQDPAFAEQVLGLPGAKNYIHVVPTEPHPTYRGTKLFYRSYHNALHNLWLLCKKCNGGSDKHDGDFMDWFRQSKFFGPDFISASEPFNHAGIIITTQAGKGVGEAAREWFLSRHKPYMLREKRIKIIDLTFHGQNIRVFELEVEQDENQAPERLNLNTRIQVVELLLNKGDNDARDHSK